MQLIRSIESPKIIFADKLVISLQHRNPRAPTNISVLHFSHWHLEEVKEKLSDKRNERISALLMFKGITVNLPNHHESTLTFPSNLDSKVDGVSPSIFFSSSFSFELISSPQSVGGSS